MYRRDECGTFHRMSKSKARRLLASASASGPLAFTPQSVTPSGHKLRVYSHPWVNCECLFSREAPQGSSEKHQPGKKASFSHDFCSSLDGGRCFAGERFASGGAGRGSLALAPDQLAADESGTPPPHPQNPSGAVLGTERKSWSLSIAWQGRVLVPDANKSKRL